MLSLTISNDVDDVDDVELDFKSIKRQKAKSNTHTHTHTHTDIHMDLHANIYNLVLVI